MIEIDEISRALYAEVRGLETPLVWPGVFPLDPSEDEPDPTPDPPYIYVQVEPTLVFDDTVKGTLQQHEGFLYARVMTSRNTGEFRGINIAKSIKTLFPRGRRIATSNGEICITQPAFIAPGRQDGPHWRTDVKVNFEAS